MAESSEKDYGDVLLAARIIQLRLATGLSMEAFAERLGISQPTQSRIERAKRLPDAAYLRALHERFRVDLNELVAAEAQAGRGGVNQTVKGSGNVVAGRDAIAPTSNPESRKRKRG